MNITLLGVSVVMSSGSAEFLVVYSQDFHFLQIKVHLFFLFSASPSLFTSRFLLRSSVIRCDIEGSSISVYQGRSKLKIIKPSTFSDPVPQE